MPADYAQRRLLSLIERSKLSDKELEALFGVHQTTVWRLKNGRISKLKSYIDKLEERLSVREYDAINRALDDLAIWSEDSEPLRDALHALHRLCKNSHNQQLH